MSAISSIIPHPFPILLTLFFHNCSSIYFSYFNKYIVEMNDTIIKLGKKSIEM